MKLILFFADFTFDCTINFVNHFVKLQFTASKKQQNEELGNATETPENSDEEMIPSSPVKLAPIRDLLDRSLAPIVEDEEEEEVVHSKIRFQEKAKIRSSRRLHGVSEF